MVNIFKSEREIDLDKLIDSRMLICANSGAGKSYAARKILEETNDKVMSIVLDVEGEFKTLREKFDFLLIGEDGDVPLNMQSAKLLPKELLELNVPTIIDISELKNKERITFIKTFLESMMELKREYWRPCLVFIDEAHKVAGQQEKQDSTWAVIDLMTRGRKRGFSGILLSQRISKLHKDAVAECGNYLVGRTNLDIDMKRTAEILGFSSKEQMLSLRNLESGEFYSFGVAISKDIIKEQVALSITTHPERGQGILEVTKPTEKIKNILKKITDLPEKAEKELKELSDYRNEIAKLKREIAKKPKEVIHKEKVVEVVDEKKLNMAYMKGVKETEKKYTAIINTLENNARYLEKALRKLLSNGAKILESNALSITADRPKIVIPKMYPGEKRIEESSNSNIKVAKSMEYTGEISINKCARTVYSLLFANPERGFTKTQIGLLTGYSHKSGGFNNAMAQLNTSNLIRKEGSLIFAEELNADYATEQQMEFNQENLLNKLGKCPREIIDVLIENPYEEFTKYEVADLTESKYSPDSGGFANSLAKLNTMDLIIRSNGKIKLNPDFLEL